MIIQKCPVVSIGMPVRNCQATLQSALKSVLAQTYSDWELLLIDDGSSDESLEIAKRFSDPRIKIHSDGKFRGLIARLNQAIDRSQGKYFARMDGDDVAYPERLEQQVRFLEKKPEIDLVGAWMMVFSSSGAALGKRTEPELHDTICRRPFSRLRVSHPTFVGRIEWFRRYGYSQQAIRCEDQDLLLRSYRYSRFSNLPEVLHGYREDKIYLRKILLGRRSFTEIVARELLHRRKLIKAGIAVIEQSMKSALDVIAVGSGLNHKLLRHRARPITMAEKKRWGEVWGSVN